MSRLPRPSGCDHVPPAKAATTASNAVRKIKIGPGEHYVTTHEDEIIVTVLGSCISACIRDPLARVGGMNHFMLPESATGVWGGVSANMRYGNYAMERLINDLLARGGKRHRMEVKVFGGAAMIENGAMVGLQNADFVEHYLHSENMKIMASHLGGNRARRVEYFPASGRVKMLELVDDVKAVARAETRFLKTLQKVEAVGSIELFD